MTNLNISHIEVLVDRSGSMFTIKEDTEGGLKSFLQEQAKQPGDCTVTLSQFDTQYDRVYTDKPVAKAPEFVLEPRWGTALHDALGKTILDLGSRLRDLPEDERPGAVTVVVLTDGMENSSHEFSAATLKEMVKEQQEKYSWNFIFMGSNQDAVLTGSQLGFAATNSLTYTANNTNVAFANASRSVAAYRGSTARGLSHGESVLAAAFTSEERAEATAE